MRLYTQVFNDKRSIEIFINKHGIQKNDIVSLFQDNSGEYVLLYYGE